MKCFHIIGGKNQGKTMLAVELIEEFTRRGLRVGSVKHSSHKHELDTPGKDSHRLRMAGANPSCIISGRLHATYMEPSPQEASYEQCFPFLERCDLIVVENDKSAKGFKVEVWRKEGGTPPLALERDDVKAVITDDPIDFSAEIWPRGDIARLADLALELLETYPPFSGSIHAKAV